MIESNPTEAVPNPARRVFTKFGYGTAVPHESPECDPSIKMLKVTFGWKGTGYIPESETKTQIQVQLKPFVGSRKLLTLVTDISTKISVLAAEAVKQLAAECEDAEEKTNLEMIIPQVFYAMGSVQPLKDLTRSLDDYGITEGSTLIMLAASSFRWNPKNLPSYVKLSNNNLTAHFKREAHSRPEYVNVMSNIPLTSGKTTWRIQIEKILVTENFCAGVATKDLQVSSRTNEAVIWGVYPLSGLIQEKTIVKKTNLPLVKVGEEVEFTVEYKGRQASFYYAMPNRPSIKLYENLPQEVYPFVTLLYNDDKVTLQFK